jgi:hypothetical protein
VDSSVVDYDGGQDVRDEERSMWQTKPKREQKAETKRSRWGFRGMTVRDWLPIVGALLIPIVLAAGTWGITWQQARLKTNALRPNES